MNKLLGSVAALGLMAGAGQAADDITLQLKWVTQAQLKGALSGYVMGVIAAFGAALAIDRSGFLRRGLLPIGNFVAALPIVGTAP